MSPDADVSCAEHIALLHLLHEVPIPQSKNDANLFQLRHGDYTLPFDRERQFAGACAFLSCIRSDRRRIPAVCVQEVPETGSLNLIIAVNKRGVEEPRGDLRDMKAGFESVFQELSGVGGTANGGEVQSRLLTAAISMCSGRIYQRLGVEKTNKRTKTSIRDILAEVIKDLRRRRPVWTDLINKAREILNIIDAWLNHKVLLRLRNIVEAMHDFSHSLPWKTFVASMPPLNIESGRVNRLVLAVEKLSRYKEATRYLYRTAKRYPIARLVRVVVVDLPPTMFDRSRLGDDVAELERVFKRTRADKQTLKDVCHLLGIRLPKARSSFKESMKFAWDQPAIHAEVQLLAFCDLEIRGIKPRVVCSSKEACFLCNLLIKTHGKMYTPYTHGRLYRGWRLPAVKGDERANELNLAMKGFVQESLTRMRREGRRINHPLPKNESATHTLVLSSTTLEEAESSSECRSEGPVEARGVAAVVANPALPPNPKSAENSDGSPGAVEPYSSLTDRAPRINGGAEPWTEFSSNIDAFEGFPVNTSDVGRDTLCPKERSDKATSTSRRRGNHVLLQGEVVSAPQITVHDKPQLFVSDSFDLLVDRGSPSPSPSSAQGFPKRHACEICWITTEEASHVLEQSGYLIVDVGTLDEFTLPLDGPTTFFLRDGDRCVLRVSIDAEV